MKLTESALELSRWMKRPVCCKLPFYYGWVVAVTFLILYTTAAGCAFAYGTTVLALEKVIKVNMAVLDWIGALPVSISLLGAPLSTWVYYKIGARKEAFLGVFCLSLSLALTSLVNDATSLFFAYAIFAGLGLTLIVNSPFFLLEEYFPYEHPRHVLATSISACAFPLGTLLFNPITSVSVEAVGWRTAYSVLASIMFTLGCLTAMTFAPKSAEHTWESLGDGDESRDSVPSSAHAQIARRSKVIIYSIWLLASSMKALGYYVPYFTLVKQMTLVGATLSQSSTAMSVIGVCEIGSRLLTSYLGERIKGKLLYLYIGCTLVLTLQNFVATLATTFLHLQVYGAALGVLGGPIIAAMYSSCHEVLLGQDVPVIFTIFRIGLGIGSVIGPTIAGGILDSTGSFKAVFYLQGTAYFLAAICYAAIIWLNQKKPNWCFPKHQMTIIK